MDELFEFQEEVLTAVGDRFYRYLFEKIDWDQRLFGILGLRGTGKTTMLLQHLKFKVGETNRNQSLYVTADHTWFYDHKLTDLASQFVKYGGKRLLIDEIHKYPNWSRELKNIYDRHSQLQVIFTASSALDILKGEADLSRRAITYELTGLSFREYINIESSSKIPPVSLDELINQSSRDQLNITDDVRPLPFFKEYLKRGYFPFSLMEKEGIFLQKLNQIINTVLEVDLQLIEQYSAANTLKIKKLLGVVSESAPFEPNITKLASRLGMGRDTIKTYLANLDAARLLNLMTRHSKGVASLQKPDKIYLENTNFSHALKNNPNVGTIRETFFVNQLRNAGHRVELATSGSGDFIVDGKVTFEIGGLSKDSSQISETDNAWLVIDELEKPYLNRVPLWYFGCLY